MRLVVLGLLVFVPMLLEARRSASNERYQLARGGIEPPDDVYRTMRIVYPAVFLAMLIESAIRGRGAPPPLVAVGALIFGAAKAIKWSAIRALGRAWTFRVIVVPGDPLVTTGPYRYLRHPNYVGVVGELLGVALMTRAPVAGAVAVLVFGTLIVRRIAVEERALVRSAPGRPPA
jgi:methyltransferase